MRSVVSSKIWPQSRQNAAGATATARSTARWSYITIRQVARKTVRQLNRIAGRASASLQVDALALLSHLVALQRAYQRLAQLRLDSDATLPWNDHPPGTIALEIASPVHIVAPSCCVNDLVYHVTGVRQSGLP